MKTIIIIMILAVAIPVWADFKLVRRVVECDERCNCEVSQWNRDSLPQLFKEIEAANPGYQVFDFTIEYIGKFINQSQCDTAIQYVYVWLRAIHKHKWRTGLVYGLACEVGDCPAFNRPTMAVRLEWCGECGILRMPEILRMNGVLVNGK